MTPEIISRIKRVAGKLARANRLTIITPVPVWDSTGSMVGVRIEGDKKMGNVDCTASASFVLSPAEQSDESKILAKATIAVEAIKLEILVSIRHKKTAAA